MLSPAKSQLGEKLPIQLDPDSIRKFFDRHFRPSWQSEDESAEDSQGAGEKRHGGGKVEAWRNDLQANIQQSARLLASFPARAGLW